MVAETKEPENSSMPAESSLKAAGERTRLAQLHPKHFFLETWREIDEEAAAERAARKAEGRGYDWRPLVALTVGGLCLTMLEYWGNSATFVQLLTWLHGDASEPSFFSELRTSRFARLMQMAYWALWRVLAYVVIPCVVIRMMGERVRDQGLATKGFRKHAWIYFLCFAVVFVCVIGVSFTESFARKYPMYSAADRSWFDLLSWEILYAAQFFALEFFFRGWWLKAMKSALGSHAIFAMVVPYVMIHFGKPGLETVGAIFAGVVLGTLAMKTRSIWSGVLIHVSVALTMDLVSLVQRGALPSAWWPT